MRLPEYAARALCRLENAGFEAWAVGGCVRDSLRGASRGNAARFRGGKAH